MSIVSKKNARRARKTAKHAKKAAKGYAGYRAFKKASPVPPRSLALIGVAAAGIVAALIAKRALSGSGDDAVESPDLDRADAAWAPTAVPSPVAPNGGAAAAEAITPTEETP